MSIACELVSNVKAIVTTDLKIQTMWSKMFLLQTIACNLKHFLKNCYLSFQLDLLVELTPELGTLSAAPII